MDTVLYFGYAFVYLLLAIWGLFYILRKEGGFSLSIFLLMVTVALVWDNAVIASGKFIGEGPLLESLNLSRFWSHAFFTPTLVLFGCWVIEQIQSFRSYRKDTRARYIAGIVTLGLIAFEVYETTHKTFIPIREYGVLRYGSLEASGPPIMVIVVILILLVISIMVFVKQRWGWMLAGVLLMLLGSAITIPVESSAVTNAFELTFIMSLWWSYYKLSRGFDLDRHHRFESK
ncbi:hypothetical protein [Paenibacillus sp. PAMC21692]|uniref:hypothetical protein n=1 Tax=Paenibacillus sp. PAMC21692 TaxID=2762320 RepID=UPI00164E3B2C|nr:hypothetical protein [Paenibacillus sp. PAMC21692]QNK60187.1 hypothetical protein H7F31_15770 [Paenibacillus sp. PAMC21692]